MKHALLLAAALVLLPTADASAASDYLLKIDGVKGEVAAPTTTTTTTIEVPKTEPIDDWKTPDARMAPSAAIVDVDSNPVNDVVTTKASSGGTVTTPTPTPQEGRTDALLEIKGVDGESTKDGAAAVQLLDVVGNPQPLTPDFSILLGGSSGELEESKHDEVAGILLQGAKDEGLAAEEISFNYSKITTKVSTTAKLFGLFSISLPATVEIDAEQRVKVRFPWWSFLASGKDGDAVGEKVFTTISNVLKTKHDTVKNSIGNIR